MIPETVGAVVGLLLVGGPGLIFEVIREHHRPAPDRSGFREAATIALASLAFTLTGLLILVLARALAPGWFPNPERWLIEGRRFVAENLGVVVGFVIALASISIGLAALTAHLIFRGDKSGEIKASSTGWFEVFRDKVPPGTSPMLRVQLHDGTEYIGLLVHYSVNVPSAEREITLGPPLQRCDPKGSFEVLPNEDAWKRVLIPSSSIESFWVRYAPRVVPR